MKADAYTKVLLTIISFCLTFNVLKDLDIVQTAQAGAPKQHLSEMVENGIVKVNLVQVNGSSVGYSTLPVEVKNRVDVGRIDGTVNVDVSKVSVGYYGIPVEVKNAVSVKK